MIFILVWHKKSLSQMSMICVYAQNALPGRKVEHNFPKGKDAFLVKKRFFQQHSTRPCAYAIRFSAEPISKRKYLVS